MAQPKTRILRPFYWLWRALLGLYRAVFVLVGIGIAVVIWYAARGGFPVHIGKNVALSLHPFGAMVEQEGNAQQLIDQIAGRPPSQTSLRDLREAVEHATHDSRIRLAVLRLDDMAGAGMPQVEELGAALQEFRKAGKKVEVYGQGFDQAQYLLAAGADDISIDPLGILLLPGVGVYTDYFKDAIDKIGVDVSVFRVGEFKSAVEPFIRNDMSDAARTAAQAFLGDLWSNYNDQVAIYRGMPGRPVDDYVKGFTDGLARHHGDAAAYALQAGLVTRIETLEDFRSRVSEVVGEDQDTGSFHQVDALDYIREVRREQHKQPTSKIALIAVEGDIVDGESENDSAGGDTVSRLLDEARRDKDVSAVVLRVNSPGGSVTAAEEIRRAVEDLQQDGKPVVASMSSLAASGGYWISMDADEIWAEPSTITGSIGIFGLWASIDRPLAKLGVHADGVGTTPWAGALRIDRPLAPELKGLLQAQVEKGYQDFIQGVSDGRDIPVAQVETMAEGRVWSGVAAKRLGLVDEMGGEAEAIASAAKLAGLSPHGYHVEALTPQAHMFAQLSSQISLGHGGADALLSVLGARTQLDAVTRRLSHFNDPRSVYAYCFCTPSWQPLRPARP